MNTKSTDFIESTSCVSRRLWVEAQGYADVCPAINKEVRTELMRINTTGETRKPGGRLLFDLFSEIKDPSIFIPPNVTGLRGHHFISSFPSVTFLASNQRRLKSPWPDIFNFGQFNRGQPGCLGHNGRGFARKAHLRPATTSPDELPAKLPCRIAEG